jgi:hypothetical protein
MVQKGLWESASISTDTLNRVKRDLDKATDAFDKLKFFQYPMDGTLVLSSLKEKKWRRMVARDIHTVNVYKDIKTAPRVPSAGSDTGRRKATRDRRK